jgi:hypothetical protein
MSSTKEFRIYEFSKKFDNIREKNGIWVSGGYVIDKRKAFDRSNYKNGHINEIPEKIREAVIDSLFEIPDAYPTNSATDQEFINLVRTGKLDLGSPLSEDPTKNIALIARNVENYSVLAVATRQIDDKWRSKLIGYRFFWLEIGDLSLQSDSPVDGISTLLHWWYDMKKPCFTMHPHSHERIDGLCKKIISVEYTTNSYKRESKTLKASRYPYLFEYTIDGSLDYFRLNAQAVHLAYPNVAWAWNVRKLSKPEAFIAVYCSDRSSYDQFFSPVLKPIALAPAKNKTGGTSSFQNQPDQPDNSLSAGLASPPPVKPPAPGQDTFNLEKILEEVASNSESPSLRLLIKFYQTNPPSQSIDTWANCIKQKVGENPGQTMREGEINYVTLLSVFIWDVLGQGDSEEQSTEKNEQEKEWAIKYVETLSVSISKYESTYKSVSQLKQNIVRVRKSLLGEDPSKGEYSNWPHPKLKLLIDIAARRHYKNYKWPITLFIMYVFFSLLFLVRLGIIPLIPGNEIAAVSPSPQPTQKGKKTNVEGRSQKQPKTEQSDKVQQLETARKFITDSSVTEECRDGGSSAQSEECKIYKETKNQLPKWPELPEVPSGSRFDNVKMLTKYRDKDNPPELVEFLQQGLKVSGEKEVGALKKIDGTLENAVKKFQKQCKQPQDGDVGPDTWQCLSGYVQKEQVVAILDYQIESLNQNKTDSEIEEHIQKCKDQYRLKPEDFIKCVKPN